MNKKLINNVKKKKKGFTLVELIIVIAIIAILAAMAIPKFGAVRLDARVSNDVAAAKNIQSATAILVANGTYKNDEGAVTVTAGDEITKRLDGNITPKAGAGTGTFVATIKDGDVTVASSEAPNTILAPATDATAAGYKKELGK